MPVVPDMSHLIRKKKEKKKDKLYRYPLSIVLILGSLSLDCQSSSLRKSGNKQQPTNGAAGGRG